MLNVFTCLIQAKDRNLVYISEDTLSGHVSEFIVDSLVTDGLWHVLSLFSNGRNMFLFLDGNSVFNITHQTIDLTPAAVEKIIVGAAVTNNSKLQHSTGEINRNY